MQEELLAAAQREAAAAQAAKAAPRLQQQLQVSLHTLNCVIRWLTTAARRTRQGCFVSA